jgi:hypothetical protein
MPATDAEKKGSGVRTESLFLVTAMLDCAFQNVFYKNNNNKALPQDLTSELEVFVLRKESYGSECIQEAPRAIPLTELEHKEIPRRDPL